MIHTEDKEFVLQVVKHSGKAPNCTFNQSRKSKENVSQEADQNIGV